MRVRDGTTGFEWIPNRRRRSALRSLLPSPSGSSNPSEDYENVEDAYSNGPLRDRLLADEKIGGSSGRLLADGGASDGSRWVWLGNGADQVAGGGDSNPPYSVVGSETVIRSDDGAPLLNGGASLRRDKRAVRVPFYNTDVPLLLFTKDIPPYSGWGK